MNPVLYLLAAVAIGVLSVARTARLTGFDAYPPMQFLRDQWEMRFGRDGWGALIFCPFCSTPYMSAVMFVWAYNVLDGEFLSDTWSAEWWWWAVNGIWGLSYLAASYVAYDQPDQPDE